MMYDEDHKPSQLLTAEIIVTWIFGVTLVGLLLAIISLSE